MENKYRLKDPALLKKDPDYSTYGPIGICGLSQAEYGTLYAEKDWPALTTTAPAVNIAPVNGRSNQNTDDVPLSGGRKCFKCQSVFHLANSPKCPHYKSRTPRNGGGHSNSSQQNTTIDAWKYLHPADENQTLLDHNGKQWFFCKHCKCRKTDKIGFYNLSHCSKDHVDNYVHNREEPKTPTNNPEGNLAEVTNTPLSSTLPNDDDDDLTFVGGWVAAAYSHGDDPFAPQVDNSSDSFLMQKN